MPGVLVLDNGAQRTLDEVQKRHLKQNRGAKGNLFTSGAAERFQKSGADFA